MRTANSPAFFLTTETKFMREHPSWRNQRRRKAYKEGLKAWEKKAKWTSNPYKEGSRPWRDWNDARCDMAEEGDIALLKYCPQLLKGS